MSDEIEFDEYSCKVCGFDKLDCQCETRMERFREWLSSRLMRLAWWVRPL